MAHWQSGITVLDVLFSMPLQLPIHVHDSLLMCAYPRIDQMSLVPSFTSSFFSNNLFEIQIFLIQKPLQSANRNAIVKACFPVEPWTFLLKKQVVASNDLMNWGPVSMLRRLARIYLRVPSKLKRWAIPAKTILKHVHSCLRECSGSRLLARYICAQHVGFCKIN